MTRLAGKSALITGGSRGIGAAVARRLSAEGASVAINYLSRRADAEALAQELAGSGNGAIALQGDVSDPAASRDLVALPEATTTSLFCAQGRLAEPEEVAAAIAFLVSPDASYVNGSTLAVNGGVM